MNRLSTLFKLPLTNICLLELLLALDALYIVNFGATILKLILYGKPYHRCANLNHAEC